MSRLPLVDEIPYKRGNDEVVRCRWNLRRNAKNMGNVGKCSGIALSFKTR